MKVNAPLMLHRGISVPASEAESIRQRILRDGLQGDEGQWNIQVTDVRDRLPRLLAKPDLSTDDTCPSKWVSTPQGGYLQYLEAFRTVCAADPLGASYYARVHNAKRGESQVSLVIRFRAPLSDVFVDGRDFLYSCFQFWDSLGTTRRPAQRALLCSSFGPAVGRYFDLACSSPEHRYRIAVCDLAGQDVDVVRAHARSKIVLGGRYGTIFRSAFHVRLPVAADRIESVEPARAFSFTPRVTYADFPALVA